MSTPFKGTINVDIRDSVPDWAPFEPPKAPDGAPSVVYIVLDDVGFSAMSCYGGPIETPNIDRIAADGVRYTQWHTTALCSPTRSCLLTGRNHTRNSMACITEAAIGFPNASGTIPPENGTLSRDPRRARLEHLHGRQVAPLPRRRDEPRLDAAQLAERPRLRALVRVPRRRDEPVVSRPRLRQPPRRPAEARRRRATTSPRTSPTRRSSSSATRRRSRRRSRSSSTTRPAPATRRTTPRRSGSTSTRAASTWATRRCASRRSPARRSSGIVPADTELPPINPIGTPETRTGPDGKPFPMLDVTRPWDSLSDDEKALFARMAEVYAGFLGARRRPDRAPARLPRGVRLAREHAGRSLVSDNGASGEGGPNGSVNEMKFANGIPDTIEANLPLLDELGGPKTYNHYPNGWAMAFNTPFKMWKRYEFNGGTSDPCIISWPAGMKATRRDPRAVPPRDRPRADDPRRARRRAAGGDQGPRPEPPSTASACATASTTPTAPTTRRTQFYSMLGSRAIWHDGWKAVTNHPTIAGWSNFNDDEWELYHTDVDRSELHNLAAEHPDKVRELVNLWFAEAGANGAFPLDDRSAARDHAHAAAGALAAARTATSTSRTRPRCPSRRRSTSATARSRSARSSTSRPRAPRACSSRTARRSAATPCTSRTTGSTTSTTSSA